MGAGQGQDENCGWGRAQRSPHPPLFPTPIPQTCVEDPVTPITLRLNFTLVGEPLPAFRNLRPMLAADAQRYFMASVSPGERSPTEGAQRGAWVSEKTPPLPSHAAPL